MVVGKKFKICVFGDSIAYGWWDFEKQGWVSRLRKFLEQKGDYRVFNLSIPGDTSKDLLKRFKNETKPREPDLIIFAIGINDSQFYIKQNKFIVNPKQFERNLLKLIKQAKDFTNKILFVGLNPVNEKLVNPLPRDQSRALKNEFVKKYNEIMRNVCKNERIKFVNIFDGWIRLDWKKLLFDGLHPNRKGHQKIFREVLKIAQSLYR